MPGFFPKKPRVPFLRARNASQAIIRCISFERGQNRLRRRRFYPPSSYPRLPGFLVPLVGESQAVPAPLSGRYSCCTSGSRGKFGSARPKRAILCCASVTASRGTVHRSRDATARFDAARSRAALRRSARMLRFYLYVGEGRRKPSQAPKFSSSPPEPSSLLSLAVRTSR